MNTNLLSNRCLCVLTVLGAAALAVPACSASTVPPTGHGNGSSGAPGTGSSGAPSTGAGATTGVGGSGSIGVGAGPSAGGAPIGSGGFGVAGSPVIGGAGTGTGGAAPVQKLCATKFTVVSTQIATFENYDGLLPVASAGPGQPAYVFAFGGATPGTAGVYSGAYGYGDGSTTPTLSILAGHTGNYGLTESVTQASIWGQGMGLWMGCVNASAYRGISFWVRGSVPTNQFTFSVSMQDTMRPDPINPLGGGTCTATVCKDPAVTGLPITLDWTQVQVLWAQLAGGLNGTVPVLATGDNIAGLGFGTNLTFVAGTMIDPVTLMPIYVPVPGDITFSIDDIAFIQ